MPGEKKRSPPKFVGELATPITIPDPAAPGQTILGSAVDVVGICERRLDLLAAHYGIPLGSPDAWRSLSLALARDFVPGFRITVARKKGRPPGTGQLDRPRLMIEVAALKKRGMTISAACLHLEKRKLSGLRASHRVLEATYYSEQKARAAFRRKERQALILAAAILPEFRVRKD